MNEIKETAQDIFALALTALFAFIVAPTVYIGYLYFSYIKMAIVGLGAMTFGVLGLAIGLTAVGLIVGLAYYTANAWLTIQAKRADVDLAQADVAYRKAESMRLAQQATVINAGQQLILSHADYPLRLVAHAAPHAPLAERTEMAQLGAPSDEIEADIMATVKVGNKWLEEFLFDEDDSLNFFHVGINGPTGAGKTWLALHLMSLIQQPYPKAEYWLLDPKFEGESSGWPFEPFVTDFEQMAVGVQYIYNKVVKARRIDKQNGVKPKSPAFAIIDEEDGCFDEHGNEFIKPLSRIIKEGRSGMVHAFVMGQSALAKDTGMNGALFRNMARFIIGNEALAFTRNAQFTYWEKPARDIIAKQLITLQSEKKRGVLVIPPSGKGLPFVGIIPDLPKPSFSQAAPVSEAAQLLLDIPTMTVTEVKKSGLTSEQEEKICEMYLDGFTLGEITGVVIGNKGGKQDLKVLNVLMAHGVELLPEHAAKLAKVRG